jgi:hypothetical protein
VSSDVSSTAGLPLTVWPCAQPNEHAPCPSRATVQVARRAIALYSDPDALVLDPFCDDSSATVPIEAIRQGRNAAAVVGHDPTHALQIRMHIEAARRCGARGEAILLPGDPPELPQLLANIEFRGHQRHAWPELHRRPRGSVDLILISVPPLLAPESPRRSCAWRRRFSVFEVCQASASVLRPGGFLLAVTGSAEHEGTAGHLRAVMMQFGCRLRLEYWQHIVALLSPPEAVQLKPPLDSRAAPPLVEHADVLVFRKPINQPRLQHAERAAA